MKSYRPGVMRVNPWCEIWELNGATSSHGFLQDFPRTTEQAGGRPEPGRLHAPPGVPHEPRSDTRDRLYNVDLAPTSRYGRTWSAYSIFTMRANDVHSLGNYGFAIGLFALGLGAWQVLTVLGVGALQVLASLALLILPWNLYTSPVVIVCFLGGLGAAALVALRDHHGGLLADPPLQRERAPALHGHPRRRVRLPRRRDPRATGAFVPTILASLAVALLPVFQAVGEFS